MYVARIYFVDKAWPGIILLSLSLSLSLSFSNEFSAQRLRRTKMLVSEPTPMNVHGGKGPKLSSFVTTTPWKKAVRRRETRLRATTMAALGLQAASASMMKRKMKIQNLNISWCAPTHCDAPIIDAFTMSSQIQDFSTKIATLLFRRDVLKPSLASRTAGGSPLQMYLKRITDALWWTSSRPAKLSM